MHRSILLVLVMALAACGGSDAVDATATSHGADASAATATTVAGAPVPATAQLMAAALQRLVDGDEGGLPESTSTFLVRRSVDRYAGVTGGDGDNEETVDPAGGCCGRPLTDEELAAVEAALAPAGAVQLIDDPADWMTENLRPTVAGAVIVGVGEPQIDGDTALVPVSMWCGGLCGTWLSYRAELAPDGWRIVGPEGPIAIS